MARKFKTVTLDAENRDHGKTFFLEEMDPRKAERWATRALLAFGRAGQVDMPEDFRETLAQAGMAGLAAIGLRALTSLDYRDAEPLLDEMLDCVSFVPDVAKIDQTTRRPFVRAIMPGDVEEATTYWILRSEVFELHVGFSVAAFLSRVGAAAKAKFLSSDIPTSPPSSGE